MKTLLALAALTLLAVATPVFAQAAPAASPFADPACPTLAEVEAILSKQHETFVELSADSLLNVAAKTKILVSTLGKYVVFGFVDPNGCLNGPTPMAEIPKNVGA
jgi:hypothetical protein